MEIILLDLPISFRDYLRTQAPTSFCRCGFFPVIFLPLSFQFVISCSCVLGAPVRRLGVELISDPIPSAFSPGRCAASDFKI